jgi:hypothetical protein
MKEERNLSFIPIAILTAGTITAIWLLSYNQFAQAAIASVTAACSLVIGTCLWFLKKKLNLCSKKYFFFFKFAIKTFTYLYETSVSASCQYP